MRKRGGGTQGIIPGNPLRTEQDTGLVEDIRNDMKRLIPELLQCTGRVKTTTDEWEVIRDQGSRLKDGAKRAMLQERIRH